MQPLDAEVGAHPLVFVGEQARVRELTLGVGKGVGKRLVFGFQPVKFGEIFAVAAKCVAHGIGDAPQRREQGYGGVAHDIALSHRAEDGGHAAEDHKQRENGNKGFASEKAVHTRLLS